MKPAKLHIRLRSGKSLCGLKKGGFEFIAPGASRDLVTCKNCRAALVDAVAIQAPISENAPG